MKTKLSIQQKAFRTILAVALTASGICLWITYYFVIQKSESEYFKNVQTLSSIIANTLTQLEQNTELLMGNALKVVQQDYKTQKMFSTHELRRLASTLSLTHIFIADQTGRFIRSTNESPYLIPNLFSFCDQYRQLISGDTEIFRTPIIPPVPEIHPYKFVIGSTPDRKYLIEVGIKADFISRTLLQALREDPSLIELDLFAPNGVSLGRYVREYHDYTRERFDLDNLIFNEPTFVGNAIVNFTKLASSQPKCCQCDVSNLSRAGEYTMFLKQAFRV